MLFFASLSASFAVRSDFNCKERKGKPQRAQRIFHSLSHYQALFIFAFPAG